MLIQAKIIVFDCDGVILDTVPAKTKAFKDWVQSKWPQHTDAFMYFHLGAYGISRTKQIQHFFDVILCESTDNQKLQLEVDRFSAINKQLVFDAPKIDDTLSFIKKNQDLPMFIMSGTPQSELEQLIEHHQLSFYFDRIIGSPTSKEDGLTQIAQDCAIDPSEGLFIGDANADAVAAEKTGFQFIYKPSQARFDYSKPVQRCDALSTITLKA